MARLCTVEIQALVKHRHDQSVRGRPAEVDRVSRFMSYRDAITQDTLVLR